jgi:hypothetical protein
MSDVIADYEYDYQQELNKQLWELEQHDSNLINKLISNDIFEDLIVRAIHKKAYIELCSLIHNTIELYLVRKIYNNILQSLITKNNPKSNTITMEEYNRNNKIAIEKIKIIWSNDSKKYLIEYTEISYILGVIDKVMYDNILNFNKERNTITHKLLKPKTAKSTTITYNDIKKTAKLGREIQLRLSPIPHNEKDIKNILKELDK